MYLRVQAANMSSEEALPNGLLNEHAYSITDIQEVVTLYSGSSKLPLICKSVPACIMRRVDSCCCCCYQIEQDDSCIVNVKT